MELAYVGKVVLGSPRWGRMEGFCVHLPVASLGTRMHRFSN